MANKKVSETLLGKRISDKIIFNLAIEYAHETSRTHLGTGLDETCHDMIIDLRKARSDGYNLWDYMRQSESRFSDFLDYLGRNLQRSRSNI